jgi:hypothetical protein
MPRGRLSDLVPFQFSVELLDFRVQITIVSRPSEAWLDIDCSAKI